mmetsp:Transcript_299/g.827  ORF Transcript_299/g.827 Transcript_299/m.827 type:complete len:728 (+) Transcript_299:21-2204(+)
MPAAVCYRPRCPTAVHAWGRDSSDFWKGGDRGEPGIKRSDVEWLIRTLSREQLHHFARPAFLNDCRHKFRLLDKNKSGYLERDELMDAVMHMFPAVQRKLVEKDYCLPAVNVDNFDSFIDAFDKDSDGRLSESEFPRFVQFCQAWRIHQYFNAAGGNPKSSMATNRVFNPPRVMTAPATTRVHHVQMMADKDSQDQQHASPLARTKTLQELQPLRAASAPGSSRMAAAAAGAGLRSPASGSQGMTATKSSKLRPAPSGNTSLLTLTVRPSALTRRASASVPRMDKAVPANAADMAAATAYAGAGRPRSQGQRRSSSNTKAPNYYNMTQLEYEEAQTKALAVWVEHNIDKLSMRQILDENGFLQSILCDLQAPTMGKAFTPEAVKREVEDCLADLISEDEAENGSESGGLFPASLLSGTPTLSRMTSPTVQDPTDRPLTAPGPTLRKRNGIEHRRDQPPVAPVIPRPPAGPLVPRRPVQAFSMRTDLDEENAARSMSSSSGSTRRSTSVSSSGKESRMTAETEDASPEVVSPPAARFRQMEAGRQPTEQSKTAGGRGSIAKDNGSGRGVTPGGAAKHVVMVLRELERHSPMTYSDMVGQILWRHRAQEPLKEAPLAYLVEDVRWVATESKVRDDVESTFRSLTIGDRGKMRYQEWQTVVNFMRLNPVLQDSISVGIISRIFYSATQHRMPPVVSFKEFLELLLEMGEMIQVHPAFLLLSVAANAPLKQ